VSDSSSSADWWSSLYDDAVAELFLVRSDPEELAATLDFLTRALELTPGALVFDQCCGIGSLAIPLARTGVRVIGVDQSAGYIERAAREARAAGVECRFHTGDACSFVPDLPCQAGFSWASSFGNADDDRNRAMLRRAFEALVPGGRFVLDYQHIPRVLRQFQHCLVRRHPIPGGEIVLFRESEVDLAGGGLRQTWTFLFPDGRRRVAHSVLRLYLPHVLGQMLAECGFVDISYHGGVRGEALTLDSPRCICVGRRPGP
jgi:SAM-dependent methyltransferase